MRSFASLDDRELLALAVSLEEDSARIYADYVDGLADTHPGEAERLARVRAEESGQGERLRAVYRTCFGEHLPLVRREDVKGLLRHRALWLRRPLDPAAVRSQAELMAAENERVYAAASRQAQDERVRRVFAELVAEERTHGEEVLSPDTPEAAVERAAALHRLFLLQVLQPGLAGLREGALSTLAPLFAAAFVTGNASSTFFVGLAASLVAGLRRAAAEARADDGSLTGRARPWVRGGVCGAMTSAGGLVQALPFLLPDVKLAAAVAGCVAGLQLAVIASLRRRTLDLPLGD